MTEVSVPALVPTSTVRSIADYPARWAQIEPSRTLVSVREADAWRDVSAVELHRRITALAKGLVAAGIGVGDRVAIMSRTRFEWTLADLALWTVGAVPVPIYETSSVEQVNWICRDSGAVAIIVEDASMMATVTRAREGAEALRDVWQIESGSLDELAVAGVDVADAALEERRARVGPEDLATIIYTSGTTGRPKGCELTHANFMSLAENASERLSVIVGSPGAANLIFLPLAHVFARFIEVLCLQSGVRMGHTPDPRTLLDDLATFQPTFLLAVPRVFEKIYNSSQQAAEENNRGTVFRWAAQVADRYSRALDTGSVGVGLRAQRAVADRLVFSRLRSAMGGKVEFAISGGAALGERLGHFYRGIGVVVLEGYGLTETTAPATVNTPDMIRIGTVGRPLPGVSVRVDDAGEVWVRGAGVLRGYHGDAGPAEEPLQDGWFRTGDLGELDDEGFLRLTGRTKELIITAGGKNVYPGPMEDLLRAHPLVSQCMVLGEGRPFVAALITVDEEALPSWMARQGLDALSFAEARSHPALWQELQTAVDTANEAVSRAESIRSFRVLDRDFTIADGTLTPSLKLRRGHVSEILRDEIDQIYTR